MVLFLSKDTENQLVCLHGIICTISLNSGKPGNSEEKPVIGQSPPHAYAVRK